MINVELLTHVLQLSRQMAATHDIDDLLTIAMEQTMKLVGAELCYLILLDEQGKLKIRAQSSIIDNNDDPLSHSIVGEVLGTSKPLVITDALTDNEFGDKASVVSLKMRSVMCVPLISRGEPLGVIYVENRTITGAFREEDLEPLIFFANQAAVSIENAMIIANLEERVAERTKELEQSWQEAIAANTMRTTLFGQIAHDLRNPATVIKMGLSMLSKPQLGELNEKQQNWLERASNGIEQLTELISNIFDLSKAELNALEINKEPVVLREYLERLYDIGQALPWKEDVQFKCEFPDEMPEVILDPVRIQQVIMNLISNSLKYTDEGQVVLHAKVSNDHVEIGVSDTGEGMPEESLQYAFERFTRFDSDIKRRAKGAGLGLAICRELVEKHDGEIWVESALGQGSNFVFSLPISR